jgi:hypothetical protein
MSTVIPMTAAGGGRKCVRFELVMDRRDEENSYPPDPDAVFYRLKCPCCGGDLHQVEVRHLPANGDATAFVVAVYEGEDSRCGRYGLHLYERGSVAFVEDRPCVPPAERQREDRCNPF